MGVQKRTHFPPTPRNQDANQAANPAARVGGCRAKFEIFSWVLPGGPHFFSCFGVFFFFFPKIAPRAFFNVPGLAEKTPIPANLFGLELGGERNNKKAQALDIFF